jgi:CO/xanthine dehydrogenase Mo-binding subunit
VGLAGGFKNIGFSFGYPERSWAAIELYGEGEIETVIVRQGAADVGQGVHTLMVQMAADAVGVPFEKVRLLTADTAKTENAGSASASRLTFMAGNAIRARRNLPYKNGKMKNVLPKPNFVSPPQDHAV